MNHRDWLDSLKLNDEVLVVSGGGYFSGPDTIGKVTRFTNTLICVMIGDREETFRKRDGYRPGSDPWRPHLSELTPELKSSIYHARAKRNLKRFVENRLDWDKLPLDTIHDLAKLLAPYEKAEKL